MAETEKKALKEAKKTRKILKDAGVSSDKLHILGPVIDNTAKMKVKLDETAERIWDEEIVMEYDNGGGQTGLRENPWFKAYGAMWRSYMQGVGQLLDVLPKEAARDADAKLAKPKSVLELVREKSG